MNRLREAFPLFTHILTKLLDVIQIFPIFADRKEYCTSLVFKKRQKVRKLLAPKRRYASLKMFHKMHRNSKKLELMPSACMRNRGTATLKNTALQRNRARKDHTNKLS